VGFQDLPDRPDEPAHPERASMRGADRPALKPRELPDPDERGRVYEAMRAHTSAEPAGKSSDAAGESQHGRQADTAGPRDYRGEVPRFGERWADHETRWPADLRATADPSADTPASHHRDGDNQQRSERHAEMAEAIGRVREAEPGLSADAQAIEQENKDTYGGWLEGFEHRLKGEDRLLAKVAEGLTTTSPDATAKQVLRLIPDAIRFTCCFEAENYTRGYYDIKERFESRGHEMYYSKNYWTNPEYKGVNTRWVTPEGQRFEVQFHTPDSFHAKHQVTHLAYERIRDPTTSRAELRELHAFQGEVSSWIRVPDGAADIPDIKKEGF
jgi:hypothetical protein